MPIERKTRKQVPQLKKINHNHQGARSLRRKLQSFIESGDRDPQKEGIHTMVINKKTQYYKDVDCLQTDRIQNNSLKIQ